MTRDPFAATAPLADALHAPFQPAVLRVDRFTVPADNLRPFLNRMKRTQRTLRTLDGCLRALLLTQTGGASNHNVVALVEWSDAAAAEAALAFMRQRFEETGFDPATFARELGVQADLGFYQPV
ncbi:antibiotic biosynthesis monooxygenase [Aquabacterium soli]|uniref:antibiotic biosynthesis monooxygenase n=1 Tax=Aquabacterium soli TaxID=2493092 RepID=UPI001F43EB5B|nr:antibiotic biosynthesis monooxygenase [Aquabacterium soli]